MLNQDIRKIEATLKKYNINISEIKETINSIDLNFFSLYELINNSEINNEDKINKVKEILFLS